MSSASRRIVYSLLTIVFVLLLGIMALLWVAYNRHQRLEDETVDLRRNLGQQKGQINELQKRLEDCDTVTDNSLPADTSWSSPAADSTQVLSHSTKLPEW